MQQPGENFLFENNSFRVYYGIESCFSAGNQGITAPVFFLYEVYSGYFEAVMLSVMIVEPTNSRLSIAGPAMLQ